MSALITLTTDSDSPMKNV